MDFFPFLQPQVLFTTNEPQSYVTGSGGKAACTQPGVAKGMAGETKSQRAGEAAQAEIHKGAYGD